MELGRYLDHLAADGEALVRALEADPVAPVATCPGWDVTELTRHTSGIHRWADEVVRTGATTRLSRRDMPDQPPVDPVELAMWSRQTLAGLLDTLRSTDPDRPVWTFGPEQRAAFWSRRMAHETTVHRWDGETAAALPGPIDPELAADGIDEVVTIVLRRFTPPARLHLEVADDEGRWTVAGEGPDVDVTAPAADLLLFLWGRVGPDRLTTVGGDAALLARWQAEVRL
ncbi:MAG: maleylpyruvate isomerase family mycothiol-dependent enzyme [Actinomycetota bacterium]